MVSKRLMAFWAVVDLCILAAGVVSIAASVIYRKPDLLMNMVLTHAHLTAGLALGISMLICFAVSIAAIVQANHVTIGLVILNYFLVAEAIIVLVIGSFVWFPTLTERAVFDNAWLALSQDDRITLQDRFSCCGYFNATDNAAIGGNFCTQTQVDFLSTLDLVNDNNAHFFCVSPITSFADYTLNNVFTSIYGFMAPVLCLLLASICVIYKRKEDERFKKIDAKRGGKGFV
jgi:hypothetical protein